MRQVLHALTWLVLALLSLALGWFYPGSGRAALWILAPFLAVIGIAVAIDCTIDRITGRIERRRLNRRTEREDTCTRCGSALARIEEIWVCALCDRVLDPPRL